MSATKLAQEKQALRLFASLFIPVRANFTQADSLAHASRYGCSRLRSRWPEFRPVMTGPKYLTYSQAAKLFPSNPSPNAVWRWARKGIKTRGGGRLHLQHVRSGAKIYTTAAWCDEFIAKLAERDTDQLNAPKPKVKPPVETRSTKRRRQIEQAEAEYATL